MGGSGHGNPAATRTRLNHPVIDADGHWLEFRPVITEQLWKIDGSAAADGFASVGNDMREALSVSVDERRRRRISQEAFWGSPERNTRDRATASCRGSSTSGSTSLASTSRSCTRRSACACPA